MNDFEIKFCNLRIAFEVKTYKTKGERFGEYQIQSLPHTCNPDI